MQPVPGLFPAASTDLVVVDLDAIDDGAEIGLAERDLAGGQALKHILPERDDLVAWDHHRRPIGPSGALQGRVCRLAVRFEHADPVIEEVVHLGDTILDHLVEPPRPPTTSSILATSAPSSGASVPTDSSTCGGC
ncbi:MAG: hypothetical protein AB7E81_21570 [Hyphomicrobiaceae bacterium]